MPKELEESSWRVNEEAVEHISNLVNIDLTRKEISLFAQQLNEILEYFNKIERADTQDVEATYHAIEAKNIIRDDRITSCLPKEKAL